MRVKPRSWDIGNNAHGTSRTFSVYCWPLGISLRPQNVRATLLQNTDMRSQAFVPLLTALVVGGGAIALTIGAAPRTEPFVDISLHASTLRFENHGQRLTFQAYAASVRPFASDRLDLPVHMRLRWIRSDLRPVEDVPNIAVQIFPSNQELPTLLVFNSNDVPDVRNFLRPQNIPPKADALEILLDSTQNYPSPVETNESNNRFRLTRPLPDLYLTHAQALDDTAWFVLRNRTLVPVVQPIVADLTWIGQGGITVAGPFTWTVWPGPGAYGNQTPLVQVWEGRANTGTAAPPLYPKPAGAVVLKFEVNPETPADSNATIIPERDRSNNQTTVAVAPDLIVSRAVLLRDLLSFTIRNTRGQNVIEPVQMLFQWVTKSGQPTGSPAFWAFNRERRLFPREFLFNTRDQRGLNRSIFQAIPDDAAQLRVTVNPVEGPLEFPRILEVTDQNNSVTRPRPR